MSRSSAKHCAECSFPIEERTGCTNQDCVRHRRPSKDNQLAVIPTDAPTSRAVTTTPKFSEATQRYLEKPFHKRQPWPDRGVCLQCRNPLKVEDAACTRCGNLRELPSSALTEAERAYSAVIRSTSDPHFRAQRGAQATLTPSPPPKIDPGRGYAIVDHPDPREEPPPPEAKRTTSRRQTGIIRHTADKRAEAEEEDSPANSPSDHPPKKR